MAYRNVDKNITAICIENLTKKMQSVKLIFNLIYCVFNSFFFGNELHSK